MVAGSKQSVRSAESTQELLAGDVLEVLDAPPPMRARAGSTQELLASDVVEVVQPPSRPREYSASSIAPVGIDLPPLRPPATSTEEQEEYNPTRELRAMQRRHLGPVVVAAVAVCAVILLAAGINRFSRADDTRANAAQQTTVTIASKPASTPATTTKPATLAPTTAAPKPISASTPTPTPTPTSKSTSTVASDAPSTGTILFDRPGKVWLDGKRLSGTSAMVRCGSHRVKLGPFAKSRAIDVPCGGEITVKK